MFNYFLIKLVYFLQMLSCASNLVNSEMAFSFNFCQIFGLCMYIVQKLPHKYQLTISISLVCLHAAGFTYKTPIYSVFCKVFLLETLPQCLSPCPALVAGCVRKAAQHRGGMGTAPFPITSTGLSQAQARLWVEDF